MVKKSVLQEIDRNIKYIWKNDIETDYWDDFLDKEDTLKCDLYYHMRIRMDRILRENNLRIFTEHYFPDIKYRADIVIAHYDPSADDCIYDSITDIVALFELKFTGWTDKASEDWVKNDLWKFKDYLNYAGLDDCQFYFATIYEVDCEYLSWLDARSTNNWASGRVTELDSGIIDGEMLFEVHSYNGMNVDMNDNGAVRDDFT